MKAKVMRHHSSASGASAPPDNLPLFSIILPTHNRAEMLQRAVRSVISQTFRDFELIIVDDGSTDDTPLYLSGLLDTRIKVVRREERGGAAESRNAGIRGAGGDFIAFLDDDDEYFPTFLEEVHKVITTAKDDVGLFWCGVRAVKDSKDGERALQDIIWNPIFRTRQEAYLGFLRHRGIGISFGTVIRKFCFERVGLFDEELKSAEDTDFFIRIVKHYAYNVVPQILVKVHLHDGPRLTSYTLERALAYERIIKKNCDALSDNPDIGSALFYKTGLLHYFAGNGIDGRKFMIGAFRKRPYKMKIIVVMLLFELFGTRAGVFHRKISMFKNAIFPSRL